jgi:hypothetical protein
MRRICTWLAGVAGLLCAASAGAYPLDGYAESGIPRLEHQRLVQLGEIGGGKQPPGALLPLDRVQLRLREHQDLEVPRSDARLLDAVKRVLGPHYDRYGIALLDLSDPRKPRYAEWQGDQTQNPGSVGKLLVALAVFQALHDAWGDDVEARARVLREATIVADVFSVYDHHTVRFFDLKTRRLARHPLQKGDVGSLWTYLDWMVSASSNSAAGMVQKHLILLAHYGKAYPVSREEEKRFFEKTPRKELDRLFLKAMTEPATRNGLDLDEFRQGSFFTAEGKKRVSGTSSHATPRGLVKYLVQMEKGQLVDEWSSREIKRLMYVTERRIRYASAGTLRDSAVYFKSGSLYSCQPEPGFKCRKYHGNKRNYMNSAAIVESPAGQDRLYYMVTVLSNVLRKNSAQDHQDLGRAIHAMLHEAHPARPGEMQAFGEGFIGYEQERAELQQVIAIQEALIALGYELEEADGAAGPKTRDAIKKFQRTQGLRADGQPSGALLEKLQHVAQEKGLVRPAGAVAPGR